MSSEATSNPDDSILGLSTDQLAGLTVDELENNSTAIKMMLHYYKRLVNENNTLTNDNNTLKTYVSAYDKQKSNSATGALLLALTNIPVGIGVNGLSGSNVGFGVATLALGIILIGAGIFFSFFKDRS
jgi:hypothetical protein